MAFARVLNVRHPVTPRTGTLTVVGAGTMGAGIAQVALEAGWQVRLHDPFPGAVEHGRARITDGLRRRTGKRGLTGREAETWVDERLDHLADGPDVRATVPGADLVVEAIVEDLEAKRELFATLDAVCPPTTILATNTSALSVGAIAEAAKKHPERVLGLHFFNPAPLLDLVEVVAGPRTDSASLAGALRAIRAWGKTPVRSSDSPGFIVNRVNRPFTIEALRMVEAGEASVADIDAALRAEGFPMGPFQLMDLVGLDVNLAATTGVWEGLGRPERLRPSPIQAWLVSHARLGRKSGIGFYRRIDDRDLVAEPLPEDLAPRVGAGKSLPYPEIVGRVRAAIASEAILARDAGVATEADIDIALRLGAGHPIGPFGWIRQRDHESRVNFTG